MFVVIVIYKIKTPTFTVSVLSNIGHFTAFSCCCTIQVATEQKARATYEKLIDLCKDAPDVIAPLRFLRQREIIHFKRFGEALRGIQDKLAEKKFYTTNCNIKMCNE